MGGCSGRAGVGGDQGGEICGYLILYDCYELHSPRDSDSLPP